MLYIGDVEHHNTYRQAYSTLYSDMQRLSSEFKHAPRLTEIVRRSHKLAEAGARHNQVGLAHLRADVANIATALTLEAHLLGKIMVHELPHQHTGSALLVLIRPQRQ